MSIPIDDLFKAIKSSNLSAVKSYIDSNHNVNTTKFGQTPLSLAVKNNQLEIVKLLVKAGADINKSHALEIASQYGFLEIAKYLLEMGADINDRYTLYYACLNGHLELVKFLLEAGADINKNNPIDAVSETGNLEIVKLLINKGADVNKGESLCKAIIKGNTEVVKILIDAGADVNTQNCIYPPLTFAIQYDRLNIVKLLVEHGADINYENQRGDTPLFDAVTSGRLDILKYLLSAGADIHKKKKDGTEYVYKSTGKYSIQIDKILTELGAKIYERFPDNIDRNKNIKNMSSKPQLNVLNTITTIPISISKYYIQTIDPDYDMKIITIPKGTLLYNSYKITPGKNIYEAIKDLLGILPFTTKVSVNSTEINIKGCVDKLHQKFFYSNPAGGPALAESNAGQFNACGIFETKRDMRFAILLSPAKYHRTLNESFNPPYKRICDEIPTTECECAKLDIGCSHGNENDVCLSSDFLSKHNLDGHIAMAKMDSYEKTMKNFYTFIENMELFSDFLDTHRVLFTSGRSVDIRGPTNRISGFPELVVHLYTTNWYPTKLQHTFDISYPIATARDAFKQLITKLNNSNNPSDNPLGLYTPLKLIRVSTVKNWYNIETGRITPNTLFEKAMMTNTSDIVETPGSLFYFNSLFSNQNKDLELAMDPHTGFILRKEIEDKSQKLIMEDGTTKTYIEACMPTEKKEFKTLLEETGYARSSGKHIWPKDSQFLTIDYMTGGGKRKTRRRHKQRGGRMQNTSLVLRTNLTRQNYTKKVLKNRVISTNNKKTLKPYMLDPIIESLFAEYMDFIASK